MQVNQYLFDRGEWHPALPNEDGSQLVFVFGGRDQYRDNDTLLSAFPSADIIGCTTSGEIISTDIYDESLVVTALNFASTKTKVSMVDVNDYSTSAEAGKSLASAIPHDGLRYVLVISDGHSVNGTELVNALVETLPKNTLVSGGLAGDADRFEETVVWHNQTAGPGKIVICGFYGDDLLVGHGTLGGWTPFGPTRSITKSSGNILFELDNQPALDLYKNYLGEFSEQLPSSALRFPLSLQMPGENEKVVRTILTIDEENKSMVFAGDMPEGATCQLMRANFEALVDGASGAAEGAMNSLTSDSAQCALLISCVGRRLVLGQRIFDELEAVAEIISDNCVMCGFYSYGEISPLIDSPVCKLHNQTMTITTFTERQHA